MVYYVIKLHIISEYKEAISLIHIANIKKYSIVIVDNFQTIDSHICRYTLNVDSDLHKYL